MNSQNAVPKPLKKSALIPDADAMRKIRRFLCDPNFLALENNLRTLGFFSILGTTHKERWHSAFLAWLLNPESSHNLSDFPLRRLLVVIATADLHEDASEEARKAMPPLAEVEESDFLRCRVWPDAGSKDQRKELTIPTTTPKLSFDVVVGMEMELRAGGSRKQSRLVLVIENKVKAKEAADQTDDYAKWAFDDGMVIKQVYGTEVSKGENLYRALLFLYWPVDPDKPKKGRAKSPLFRNLTYQDLVDEVIGPCEKHPALSDQGRVLVREYLHNLAHQNEDQETTRIAVTPEEETLVNAICVKHPEALRILTEAGGKDHDCQIAGADTTSLDIGRGESLVRIRDLVEFELLAIGDELRYKRGDVDTIVKVAEDGCEEGIKVNGQIYAAPSSAAKEIYGQVCRGWDRFTVEQTKNPESKNKTLFELREIFRKKNERPQSEYSLKISQYAAAVLRAHRTAFLVLQQVTRKTDGEAGLKLPDNIFGNPIKQWIDYTALLSLITNENGFVRAHFKGHPEIIARIDLQQKQPIFYLGDDKQGRTGLQATRTAATECKILNTSASYQWAAHWCVVEGKFKGETFSAIKDKLHSGAPNHAKLASNVPMS